MDRWRSATAVRGLGTRRRPGLVAAVLALGIAAVLLPVHSPGVVPAWGGRTVAAAAPDGPSCGPAWVGAWQAGLQPGPAELDTALAGRTVRMIVQPQVTGSEVRVRVSNRFGRAPLVIGSVSAATAGVGAALVPGTARPVFFGGRSGVVVPPGRDLASDPVPFVTQRGAPLAVSLFLPQAPDQVALHPVALQTSYVSAPGDAVDSGSAAPFTRPVTAWYVLAGVDVLAPHPENAVVLVGDSITDGVGSAVDAGERWSDALSARLAGERRMPVLNAGISANQLLGGDPATGGETPWGRYAHDVGTAPGVTDVVLHIGTNDLAAGRDAAAITAGLAAFADRVRADGRRVFLTTVTPSEAGSHGTPWAVAQREQVNAWIRTQGPAHADGVFDFAAAVADPAWPTRLAAAFDAGDGLHLSAAGYRALAAAVDIGRLSGSPCLARGEDARVVVSGGR